MKVQCTDPQQNEQRCGGYFWIQLTNSPKEGNPSKQAKITSPQTKKPIRAATDLCSTILTEEQSCCGGRSHGEPRIQQLREREGPGGGLVLGRAAKRW
jgi:hypothetical protein